MHGEAIEGKKPKKWKEKNPYGFSFSFFSLKSLKKYIIALY